jgi:hypothetical protein
LSFTIVFGIVMPFVVWRDSDIDRLRYYLGIPLTSEKTTLITNAMTTAEELSQDAVKRVRLLLDELDAADREINSARPFSGQRFANGTTWFQNKRLESIKAEARRLAVNVARILALDVEDDVWADLNVKGSQVNFISRS